MPKVKCELCGAEVDILSAASYTDRNYDVHNFCRMEHMATYRSEILDRMHALLCTAMEGKVKAVDIVAAPSTKGVI